MALTIYKIGPGTHGPVVVEEGKTMAKMFTELHEAGWSTYDVSNPQQVKKVTTLDPAATLVIAVPWRS
jgi:hypothetical protein